MKVNSTLLAALVAAAVLTGCNRGSAAARVTAVAGQATGVVQGVGSAAGTAVVVSADALPAGATVKIFPWLIDAPPGFAAAGPAARIEFSAPLTPGQNAIVTLPFDPCLVLGQGAVPNDIVVVIREYDGPTRVVPPLVVDAGDETVQFDVTASVAVMALVPEGSRAPIAPLVGLSTHGIAVMHDNSVWTWGLNYAGQLAEDTRSTTNEPWLVPELDDVVAVEAGDGFSVMLMADGTIEAWGANFADQLGLRTNPKFDHPAPIIGLGCMERIAVGPNATTVLALGRDGMLYSWGDNVDGQAGRGSTDRSLLPGAIPDIDNPRDFDVSRHGLAALRSGEVMAWGQNFRGQLGDGTFSSSNVPVMVSGLDDVDIVAVAVGWQFSLALSSAGEVWAWGANESGQLGDDTLLDRAEPARVEGLEDIVAIEASSRTALALDATGNLWTWGSGEFGQLGNGSFDEFSAEPLRIGKLATSVVDFDAGLDCFVLALDDGRLLTWGLNNVGTLGDGSYFNRNAPVEVETPFGTGEAPTDFVPCDPDVDPDRCRARR